MLEIWFTYNIIIIVLSTLPPISLLLIFFLHIFHHRHWMLYMDNLKLVQQIEMMH